MAESAQKIYELLRDQKSVVPSWVAPMLAATAAGMSAFVARKSYQLNKSIHEKDELRKKAEEEKRSRVEEEQKQLKRNYLRYILAKLGTFTISVNQVKDIPVAGAALYVYGEELIKIDPKELVRYVENDKFLSDIIFLNQMWSSFRAEYIDRDTGISQDGLELLEPILNKAITIRSYLVEEYEKIRKK